MKMCIGTLRGLTLVVLTVLLANAQGKANFSGTWILDKSKSDISQLLGTEEQAEKVKHASLRMVIEHQGTTLKVARTLKVQEDEKQGIYTYKTDGSETTNTGPRGGSIVSKAFWEGEHLVIVSTRHLTILWKELSATSKEVWHLSSDGQALTIDAQIHSPRGDHRVKAVFGKQ